MIRRMSSRRRQPAWHEQASELIQELVTLRGHGIGVDSLLTQPIPLPELASVARAFMPDLDNMRQYDWVTRLFEVVLGKLGSETHKNALTEVFGLKEAQKKGLNGHRRRERAAEVYNYPFHTYRKPGKHEQILFERVEMALEELKESSPLKIVEPVEVPPFQLRGKYARRRALERDFDNLFSREEKLIALVGDKGTGKSRLAWELMKSRPAAKSKRRSLWIDGTSVDSFDEDVLTVLEDSGVDYRNANTIALRRLFWNLLYREGRPPLVVIDNLGDKNLLQGLKVSQLRSTVVVTATHKAVVSGSGFELITVTNLVAEEATNMVSLRLPELDSVQVRLIARTSGGRPLAIETMCAMIHEDGFDSEELCSDIRADAARMFNLPSSEDDVTLTAVYVKATNALTRANPVALSLLILITFSFVERGVSQRFLVRCLRRIYEVAFEEETFSRAYYSRSLPLLQDRFLVTVDRRGVRMHSLTQAILRKMYAPAQRGVRHVIDAIAEEDASRLSLLAKGDGEAISSAQYKDALHGMMQMSHYEGSPFTITIDGMDSWD